MKINNFHTRVFLLFAGFVVPGHLLNILFKKNV
jgi:hypothetical protein